MSYIRALFGFLSGIFFLWASLIIAEGFSFNILTYWDLSSAFTILGGLIFIFVNFTYNDLDNLFIIDKEPEKFLNKVKNKKLIVNTLGKNLLSFTIITSCLAIIIILGNLNDMRKLGPSLAILLITPLYYLIIKMFLVIPTQAYLEKNEVIISKNTSLTLEKNDSL
ncbi:MAG: hypothetical protein U0457_19590 [Candidatus Sericytochromatia bacterium]